MQLHETELSCTPDKSSDYPRAILSLAVGQTVNVHVNKGVKAIPRHKPSLTRPQSKHGPVSLEIGSVSSRTIQGRSPRSINQQVNHVATAANSVKSVDRRACLPTVSRDTYRKHLAAGGRRPSLSFLVSLGSTCRIARDYLRAGKDDHEAAALPSGTYMQCDGCQAEKRAPVQASARRKTHWGA